MLLLAEKFVVRMTVTAQMSRRHACSFLGF